MRKTKALIRLHISAFGVRYLQSIIVIRAKSILSGLWIVFVAEYVVQHNLAIGLNVHDHGKV